MRHPDTGTGSDLPDAPSLAPRASPAATLGWAAFLAASWTWCIGMFLPTILVRDYGPGAFLAFAIPNVLGAAAMGWVLAKQGQSERFVAAHRRACIAFSWVTVAFHAFFLAWVGPQLAHVAAYAGSSDVAVPAAAVVLTLVLLGARLDRRLVAAVSLLVSAALITLALRHPLPPGPSDAPLAPALPALALVCLVGFALCPYLDLTFHQARQALPPRPARVAFSLGFGLLFLAMIVGTYLYTPLGIALATAQPTRIAPPAAAALLAHFLVQALVTVAFHADALRAVDRPARTVAPAAALSVLAALVGAVLPAAPLAIADGVSMTAGEIGYRTLMSAYGLAFPAYLLLARAPWRGAWVAAVLLIAPLFGIGFLAGRPWFAAAGVAALFLSAMAVGPARQRVVRETRTAPTER